MKYLTILLLIFPLFCFSNPTITKNHIHFEYTNPHARNVKMLISFDNYKTFYSFVKIKDKWVIDLNLSDINFQLKKGRYFYKFIVNNIHITDPKNPNFATNPYFGKISYFDVNDPLIAFAYSPQKIGHLKYRFYYKNNSGWHKDIKEVQFAGTFNHWQPYQLYLKKMNHNLWYIDYQFEKPGTIHYQYVVDGKWQADINNSIAGFNQLGDKYSVVHVRY